MNPSGNRKLIIIGIFLVVGLAFLSRLFYIQIIDKSYKLSAENNFLHHVTQYPSRGMIYDRKGKLLVYNEPIYDLMVTPKLVKVIDTMEFCRLVGISKEEFDKKLRLAKKYSKDIPSPFEKQLSKETYGALMEKLDDFSGFFVQSRTVRRYAETIAAHLLGDIGDVDSSITKTNRYYKDGDYIGKSGIEYTYEPELRGKKGSKLMMVDVRGRQMGSYENGIYDTLAVKGENLTASLDADLQSYGEALMQNKIGGIAAIEPSTGEILAMVSAPSYDPNLLVGRERAKNYEILLTDKTRPLYNRALLSAYPPGSTFKIIMALIAQQEGVLGPETRYPCAGGYPPGGGKPACHHHPSPLDLALAISYSCNSYFSYVFKSVMDQKKFTSTEESFENWRKHVLSFGYGRKLGVDLPSELSGGVPTIEHYDKVFGEGHWRSSTILSLGIGQGEMGASPLKMANAMAIVANHGYYYIPHVIKAIGDKQFQFEKYTTKNYTTVSPEHFFTVIEGMYDAVESGTASASKIKDIEICGKTGTAENPGKSHSVFFGFAPKENPKIAIAVMVEHGGWGADWAAPIAILMIEKYLKGNISRPDIEKRMLDGVVLPAIK
ncbi:MAG: penicillin-binding protein 2 [Bacteroidota bacterium]